jgi:hypothetical protein
LEYLELSLVGLVDGGEGNYCRVLLVAESTEAGLVLDDEEGDFHFTAEGGKPHDKFDGVDVACDEDEGGLLLFDEGGHVLETEFELMGYLGGSVLLGSDGSGGFLDALLFGRGGFGAVLVQQGEDAGGLVLADGLGELVDGRGDLEALVEDGALALDADVLGPLDEAGEIAALGTDGATNGEGAGCGGEEGVRFGRSLDGSLGRLGFGGGAFLGCHCCERWVDERKRIWVDARSVDVWKRVRVDLYEFLRFFPRGLNPSKRFYGIL